MMMEFFESLENIRLGSFSLLTILSAILLFLICAILRKVIMRIFTTALDRSAIDGSVKSFLRAAVSIVLWVLVLLIVLDHMGIPMTSLVAALSVVGLALSLSVQNILTNLFSGMTILATKPFGAGDFVDIGGTTGTVVSVGLFYTVLNSVDGRVVHLPNGTITTSKVENYSTNPTRRIDLEVAVSYECDTETVKKALLDAANATEGVIFEPAPFAAISKFGESAVIYTFLVWANTDGFMNTKFTLTENIRASFAAKGVAMTYNHLNVHISQK